MTATQRMRIGMLLFDPQSFGGLEEYAVNLAIGLARAGHAVSVVTATWTSSENQYIKRLLDAGIELEQPPRALSLAAADWPTKERILDAVGWCCAPAAYVLGAAKAAVQGRPLTPAIGSARNWIRSRAMGPVIRDRRPQLARWTLDAWRRRWRPDVLHIHGYTSTLLFAVEWAHARRVPVAYEEHQTPDARFDWWQDSPRVLNKADVVIAVSEASAEGLRAVCQVTRPIVVRAPLLPDPGSEQTRPSRDGAAGPLRVTAVARLVEAKGLAYLLEAVAALAGREPTLELRVWGQGPLRNELVAHANRLGLDGEAIFTGVFTTRDHLAQIMAGTDIFAMPSLLEGQPLGLIEAMAYGRAIVTTPAGGIGEVITDGENGLLCRPADADSLAAALLRLARDADLRRRLAAAARRSYERSAFQPDAVCASLAQVYARLAKHDA